MVALLSSEQITNEFLPDAYIDKIVLETDATGKAKVSVDVHIIRKQDINSIYDWFGDNDFSKYFKIGIIQRSSDTQDNSLSENDKREISTSIRLFVEENISRILDITSGNISSEDRDNQNNKIIVFTYRFTFELDKYPKFLSYTAFSLIDTKQLSNDNGTSFSSEMVEEFIGRIATERVLDNSKIVSNSYSYLTPTGDFWTSQVYSDQQGLYGISSLGVRIPITEYITENAKIQDFRNFEIIRESFDIPNYQDTINKQFKNIYNKSLKSEPDKTYFSEFLCTPDTDGNNNFLFGIDIKKILKNNCFYPKIVEKINIPSIKIKTLDVYRNRIKGSPEVGSVYRGKEKFNKNDLPVKIGSLDGFGENTFILQKQNISGLSIKSANSIVFYEGSDRVIKNETDGYYVYSIKISLMDETKSIFDDRISLLKNTLNSLNAIKQNAENNSKKYYDFSSDRFKDIFIAANNGNNNKQYVDAYLDTLLFFDIKTQSEIDSEKQKFYNCVDLSKTTLSALYKFIETVKILLDALSSIRATAGSKGTDSIAIEHEFNEIFNSNNKFKGYDVLYLNGESNNVALKLISANDFIKRTTDENKYYLSDITDTSLKVGNETFSISDTIKSTQYSYLSPWRFIIDKNKSLTKDKLDSSNYKDLEFNLIDKSFADSYKNIFLALNAEYVQPNNSLTLNVTQAPSNENYRSPLPSNFISFNEFKKTFKLRKTKILTLKGVSIPIQDFLSAEDPVKNLFISIFNKSDIKKNTLSFKIESYDLNSFDDKIDLSFYNSSDRTKCFIYKILDSNRNQYIKSLPNQIKSLLLRSAGTNNKFVFPTDVNSPDKFLKFKLDYHFLYSIEAFEGFIDDNISKPIWNIATETKLFSATNRKKLFRIMKYENSSIGINRKSCFEMDHFDKYFLLNPIEARGPIERTILTGAGNVREVPAVRRIFGSSNSRRVENAPGQATGSVDFSSFIPSSTSSEQRNTEIQLAATPGTGLETPAASSNAPGSQAALTLGGTTTPSPSPPPSTGGSSSTGSTNYSSRGTYNPPPGNDGWEDTITAYNAVPVTPSGRTSPEGKLIQLNDLSEVVLRKLLPQRIPYFIVNNRNYYLTPSGQWNTTIARVRSLWAQQQSSD